MKVKAFTIFELLVVVLTICILATIIFPVLSLSKVAAKRQERTARLTQAYMSLQMYRADCDDMVFVADSQPGRDWPSLIKPYCGANICSANPAFDAPNLHVPVNLGEGFSVNTCVLGRSNVQTENPVMFFETASLQKGTSFLSLLHSPAPDQFVAAQHEGYWAVGGKFLSSHDNDGSLYVFWDGNVEYFKYLSISNRISGNCSASPDGEPLFESMILATR